MKNRRENEKRSAEQSFRDKECDTNRAKAVEFFAASVNAWYNTALEHDKSIFALSAGGIGLLMTLLTTVGVTSALTLWLYVAAITCFLLCLAVILFIFKGNRDYILDVVVNGTDGEDPKLAKFDVAAMLLFWGGVFFAAVVGLIAAYSSYINKGSNMANDKQNPQSTASTMTYDSVNGVGTFTKSFNGAGKLQPSASAQSASTTKPTPQPAQQAASTPKSSK